MRKVLQIMMLMSVLGSIDVNAEAQTTEALYGQPLKPAMAAVLDKLDDHQIVAIGDAHFYSEVMSFITDLVTQPEFSQQVRHIIVEFGNAQHQALLDNYLMGGDVSEQEIKQVWQDALYFTAWTPKVYADFFKRIRAYNSQQDSKHQIRVTLAEAAFDWQQLYTRQAWQKLAENKVSSYVNRIRSRLAKDEKAVMVFGALHTLSLSEHIARKLPVDRRPLISQLEVYGYDVYAIWPLIQPTLMAELSSQGALTPGFIDMKESVVGKRVFVEDFAKAKGALQALQALKARTEELFDGLLYLGDIKANYTLHENVLEDQTFIDKGTQRVRMIGGRVEVKFMELLEQHLP